jgi:hypothetical protein
VRITVGTTPRKPESKCFRAITYAFVGVGLCESCNGPDPGKVPLRFAYNPNGDDALRCDDCANAFDEAFAEHARNDR